MISWIFISLMAAASDYKTQVDVPQNGQCVADIVSKKYLNNPTDKVVYFTCEYDCQVDGQLEIVVAKHVFDKSTGDEMLGLGCSGVTITKINHGSYSEIYPSRVSAMWAVFSGIPELIEWASVRKAKISNEEMTRRIQQMRSNLLQVVKAFKDIHDKKYEEYPKAADLILEFLNNSNTGKKLWLDVLDNKKWTTKEHELAALQIKSHAAFLIRLTQLNLI